jgi:hypothetical protein
MFGCGAVVHSWTVGMVRSVIVFSGGGLVVMEAVGVTTLHPRGSGNPELPPSTKAVSPSLEDFSRMVCTKGDLFYTIPTNMTPESFISGERLRLSKWSAMNSKLPKQIVSPGMSPTLVRLLSLATKVSFSE